MRRTNEFPSCCVAVSEPIKWLNLNVKNEAIKKIGKLHVPDNVPLSVVVCARQCVCENWLTQNDNNQQRREHDALASNSASGIPLSMLKNEFSFQ